MANFHSINGNEIEAHYAGGELAEDLGHKADSDGYYAQMTVGAADNLTGRGDAVPATYLHRTAGGTASIESGQATVESIHGRTLAWNQHADHSMTGFTKSRVVVTADGNVSTFAVNSDNTGQIKFVGLTFPIGHKVLVKGKYTAPENNGVNVGCYQTGGVNYVDRFTVPAGTTEQVAHIFTTSQTADREYGAIRPVVFTTSSTTGVSCTVEDLMVFDLTQMFGAGNEPSTVAEFESLFPLPYYPYDAGSLLPVRMEGIETVGFNAYDPSTGTAELLGGNQYQITGTYTSLSYSTGETLTPDASGLFTPADNGTLTVTGGNATDTCVHLVWSGIKNGEYEAHWKSQRAIPVAQYFPDGMRGAGSVYDELTEDAAITRVGERAYQSGDEDNAAVVTDGTVTHYALATPTTTPIDQPLNLTYRVDDWGTERVMVDEAQPAPQSAPPTMQVAYGVNAIDTLRNLPKDYVSAASDTNLCAALASALGLTITRTWDATKGEYDYAITQSGE